MEAKAVAGRSLFAFDGDDTYILSVHGHLDMPEDQFGVFIGTLSIDDSTYGPETP
jgi:hypothetical protein